VIELLPYVLVLLSNIALVRFHDVHHHLGVLLLFSLGYTGVCEHAPPIWGQALFACQLQIPAQA
jgi:hypothetical protein